MSDSIRACQQGFHPVALTIAGSDSGGGAGIQADLRAFHYFQVHGTTAITAVTAQNPDTVTGIAGIAPDLVIKQLDAVAAAFHISAIKTGMLFSAPVITAVSTWLETHPELPTVIDPVMIATSGSSLLQEEAITILMEQLLPLATVITPNLPEAELLLGDSLETDDDMREGAIALARRYDALVIIKGGHRHCGPLVDGVSDGSRYWELRAPRCEAKSTHGTGCSFSAAIAAALACGNPLLDAIVMARRYVQGSLSACVQVGSGTWTMAPPKSAEKDGVVFQSLDFQQGARV